MITANQSPASGPLNLHWMTESTPGAFFGRYAFGILDMSSETVSGIRFSFLYLYEINSVDSQRWPPRPCPRPRTWSPFHTSIFSAPSHRSVEWSVWSRYSPADGPGRSPHR